MESYYSSDEEIAWGPVTLREIKGDLKRPVRKPNRRHTVPYNFQMNSQECLNTASHDASPVSCEDTSHLSQEFINKLNVSPTSTEYYTPNESLRTENNYDFLEKLSKAINEPQSFVTCGSALDNTKASISTNDVSVTNSEFVSSYYSVRKDTDNINDTCFNFVKSARERNTNYDIANFQQTLIDSPLSDSETAVQKLEKLHFIDENSLCDDENVDIEIEEAFRKGTSIENIVLISDDEESDNSERYVDIKERSSDKELSIDSLNIREDEEISGSIKNEKILYENDSLCENISESNEGISFSEHRDSIDRKSEMIEERGLITRIVPQIPPTIQENKYLNTSPISLPDIDLAQFDDSSSKNNSPQLNDTMEEMNRLLNEGLSYTVSDDDSVFDSTPLKSEPKLEMQFTPSNIISGSFSHTQIPLHISNSKPQANKTPSKTNQLLSDKKQINRFIVKKAPDSNFKIPERPVRPKLTIPTPPKPCHSHLKNVVSPVALYIKNSPNMVLRQNVPQRELSRIVTATKIPKPSSKENFPDLPEVVYKPSKKQIVSSERKIVLPPSIKRLNVKEPSIVKHEGRILQSSSRSKVSRKLLETEITNSSIDSSVLNDSKDISVLTSKQAFIK